MNHETILKLNEIALNHADKLVILPYQHGEIDPHKHLFFELVYVLEGTANHTLDGITTALKKGDYFIVDFDSSHRYWNCQNLSLINCLFLPEMMDETLKGCHSFELFIHRCLIRYYKLSSTPTTVNRIFHDKEDVIFHLLTRMQEEYQKKQFGYTKMFQSLLIEILILTMRQVIGDHTPPIQSSIVSNVIQYLQEHYMDHHILQNFCHDHHFSPQYISRKFKQETGLTIMNYLQNIRIEKSCDLLLSSDKKVTEIAYLVGYNDVKYFQTIFKKALLTSPSAYRKMNFKS